jgi:hypothetical protein
MYVLSFRAFGKGPNNFIWKDIHKIFGSIPSGTISIPVRNLFNWIGNEVVYIHIWHWMVNHSSGNRILIL